MNLQKVNINNIHFIKKMNITIYKNNIYKKLLKVKLNITIRFRCYCVVFDL